MRVLQGQSYSHEDLKDHFDTFYLSRVAVAKGASLVSGWALSRGSKEAYWGLYKAVWAGAKGEDCSVAFPVTGHTCDTFSWQKQQMMNTQYDHTEL